MPVAVRLYRIAGESMGRLGKAKAGRLVLSLFFKAALGIQRIFHFETLDDPGFAALTGGARVLGRSALGSLVRAAPLAGVRRLMKATAPTVAKAARYFFSIDEHVVPRFTRKFDIPKGFHTIRNKHMKIEKLFFPFDIASRKLLPLIATAGDSSLGEITRKLLTSLRRRARGGPLRVILDAGAAQNHDVLLDLADHPNQVTLVRTPRRPAYRKVWEQLPHNSWKRLEEPGRYTGAPAKAIHIAETSTLVKGASGRSQDVRTIVVREEKRDGKDRWHALWVFGDNETDSYEVVEEFRTRQHHEQAYRVMLHDAHVDTAPSGYDKESPDPEHPRFNPAALTLYAWIAALATNTLLSLSSTLPQRFHRAHPRTLRRWFLNVPAELFVGTDTFIVLLRPRRCISAWEALVHSVNRRNLRIPWFADRRLILSLPGTSSAPELGYDPLRRAPGVWC